MARADTRAPGEYAHLWTMMLRVHELRETERFDHSLEAHHGEPLVAQLEDLLLVQTAEPQVRLGSRVFTCCRADKAKRPESKRPKL